MNKINIIACTSGIGGADIHSGDGPLKIKNSPFLNRLINQGLPVNWHKIISPPANAAALPSYVVLETIMQTLAQQVSTCVKNRMPFTVLGGDHTCAIGTWSGAYDALHAQGDIGLIWFDAHMDSHTPETSESGNIHGMPLAALLGHGHPLLTNILHANAKVKPENLCLIGVRSFEQGEADLLKKLNVKVYYMDEIQTRGLLPVLQEALALVTRHTIGYGVSFDIDSLDPKEAPGVDVPEPDGLHANEFKNWLGELLPDERLIGIEIVEFDPLKDRDQLTEKLVVSILEIIAKRMIYTDTMID